MTYAEQIRNAALDEAAEVARRHFIGIFTGWKGYVAGLFGSELYIGFLRPRAKE